MITVLPYWPKFRILPEMWLRIPTEILEISGTKFCPKTPEILLLVKKCPKTSKFWPKLVFLDISVNDNIVFFLFFYTYFKICKKESLLKFLTRILVHFSIGFDLWIRFRKFLKILWTFSWIFWKLSHKNAIKTVG